jgi:CheY-like chemotaxis protein
MALKIAQELRAGNVFMIGNDAMVVLKTEYSRSGRSGAVVKMKYKNLLNGAGGEWVFSADDKPVVLHVDDDRDILEVTRQALDTVEVVPVESLAAAREALARRRPDLVILDLGLPDGNGLDLLPLLTEEDGRTIPVIIYSAQDMDREAAPAVQAVLIKSRMSLTQLARTVRRLAPRARGVA